ncbi:MAG: patatin-like phospholipase family protein [Acidobacteriota bacterium]|nr:patatin-like phospholipase family protein [Acidobacteriota bacterium]
MARSDAHALSFAEVLEDEYQYFSGDVEHEPIEFTRRHVREIGALAKRLDLTKNKARTSRWHLLAREVDKQPSVVLQSDDEAIVAALNAMLRDEQLLEKLLAQDDSKDVVAGITQPVIWRALLRLPVARLLVLQHDALRSAIAADSALIASFEARSPVIRLLVREGFSPALQAYPELLSTIADNEPLAAALLAGDKAAAGRIERLRKAFMPEPEKGAIAWLRAHAPAPWRRKQYVRNEKVALQARSMKDVAAIADPALPVPSFEDDRYFAERLTRFNAVLIETVYGDHVSDDQSIRSLYGFAHKQEFAALCLSGGGIRSATFNLGVLQGLADHRMLNRLHYISTVSGGGYIGGWLSSWMRRHNEGAIGVAKDLSREPVDPLEPEVRPIRHLREYSSYLAPHASAFSADTWTIIAMYVRNLLLNWTMLLPALAAVLAVPRFMEAYLAITPASLFGIPSMFIAAATGAFAIVAVGFVRPRSDRTGQMKATQQQDLRKSRRKNLWWLVPLLLSGVTFCGAWADGPITEKLIIGLFAGASAVGALAFAWRRASENVPAGHGWMHPLKVIRAMFRPQNRQQTTLEIAGAMLAGAFCAKLLLVLFGTVFPREGLNVANALDLEKFVIFGLPLFLAVMLVEATLIVGLTTSSASEHDREWWARSAAILSLCGVFHIIGACAVIVLPILVADIPEYIAPLGGVAGIASWFLRSRLLKTKTDTTKGSGRSMMLGLQLAATVTLLLFIGLLALATTKVLQLNGVEANTAGLPWTMFGSTASDLAQLHLAMLRQSTLWALAVFIGVAVFIATCASWLLNVNIYSMHGMYRNRLMRAYLGASRWNRHPDAFTGFDPQDNIALWKLRPEALWPSSFVDFEAFASALTQKPAIFKQLDDDIRTRVVAFAANGNSEDAPQLKSDLVDALNELMLQKDLAHGSESVPSIALFRTNRDYLNDAFPECLKRLEERPAAAEPRIPIRRSDDAPAEEPLRARPPLHIVNAALNLVGGENLAWQERKAASFTMSPLHCGSRQVSYRDSAVYAEGVSLGTAVAISGAAVSPNMGSLSSPVFTFLMALFNARLGWWLGNPRDASAYRNRSPKNSLGALMREALGRTDDTSSYVFLSDGGFFENLGLYEMVARRCKHIIVCDASADGSYGFSDLGNAVRKIRIDLGIPIELKTKYIAPSAGERHGRFCATGRILYPDVDGVNKVGGEIDREDYERRCGKLIYIKPAVFESCPPDVRNYRTEHESFPHDTTADQFFNESQFESYRALGRHAVGAICGDTVGKAAWTAPSVSAFFDKAFTYVDGAGNTSADIPVTRVGDIVKWMNDSL